MGGQSDDGEGKSARRVIKELVICTGEQGAFG